MIYFWAKEVNVNSFSEKGEWLPLTPLSQAPASQKIHLFPYKKNTRIGFTGTTFIKQKTLFRHSFNIFYKNSTPSKKGETARELHCQVFHNSSNPTDLALYLDIVEGIF